VYHWIADYGIPAASSAGATVLQELKERLVRLVQGSLLSAGLGVLNFVGALVLGNLLADGIAAELGGLVAFVQGIYWLLLGYIRLFWACRWYVISGFNGAIARLAITINSGKHGRSS